MQKILRACLLALFSFIPFVPSVAAIAQTPRITMAYMGAYSAGTRYTTNDTVSVGSVFYISLLPNNQGNSVTNTQYWLPWGSTSSMGGGTGTQGPAGTAATIAVGSVTPLSAGSNPTVTNAGTSLAAIFNFGIPAGATGATGPAGPTGPTGATGPQGPAGSGSGSGSAGTIAIGSVTALGTGVTPTVTNVGTSTAAILNFGLAAGPVGPTGAQGPQGQTGPAGPAGTGGIVSDTDIQNAKLYNNLLDPATVTAGTYLTVDSGNTTSSGSYGWGVSDFIPITVGQTWVYSDPMPSQFGAGFGYFDSNHAFISGTAGGAAAGTVYTAPANAAYLRVDITTPSTIPMLIFGSVLPTTFVPYGLSPAEVAVDALQTTVATNESITTAAISETNASITGAVTSGLVNNNTFINLFNPATITASTYIDSGTGLTAAAGGAFTAYTASDYFPVLPGAMVMNKALGSLAGGAGIAFYNSSQAFISGVQGPIAAGAAITIPAGAAFSRITLQAGDVSSQMVILGSTVPTTFVPFGRPAVEIPVTNAIQAQVTALQQPFAGKRLAIFGDSYTATYGYAWQPNFLAKTGLTIGLTRALGGRSLQNIFVDYTAGSQTVLQQIAADLANIDVVLIEMGTNDMANTTGSPGDASTAATEYGYAANAVQTIQQAKPGVQIIWVGAIHGSYGQTDAQVQSILAADKYVANFNGVPFIDVYSNSGIGPQTWTTLLRDGALHLTDAAYATIYADMLAKGFKQYVNF